MYVCKCVCVNFVDLFVCLCVYIFRFDKIYQKKSKMRIKVAQKL